jgi:Uma2 family endonuclease
MSALPHPPLLSIEDFDKLEWPEDIELELLDGEVLEVTFPAFDHVLIQDRIAALVRALPVDGFVAVELGYEIRSPSRPTKRRADVGYVSPARYQESLKSNRVTGAPNLTVEVISPSNTFSLINRLGDLCLSNGCQEFWIVDPPTKTIHVRHAGENTITVYQIGDTIRLHAISGEIRVADVFAISSDR